MKARRPPSQVLLATILCLGPLSFAAQADQAWQRYEDGAQAFAAKRLDKALAAWQEAVTMRKARFESVVSSIDAAMAEPEAKNVRDSVSELVRRFGIGEFGSRAFGDLLSKAQGSMRREMEALHLMTRKKVVGDFTDAWLAVEELRGAESIHDSLSSLRSLAAALRDYPEAEYGIGKVFFAEGELGLAELQYRRALDEAGILEVPDERDEIVLSLAEVAKAKGDLKSYEDRLSQALAEAPVFAATDSAAFLRTAMERALDIEGFDSLVRLYPLDDPRIVKPASLYGEFLLRSGRSPAVQYLAFAADAAVTEAVKRIRAKDPGFSYPGLPALADRMAGDQDLSTWWNDAEVWKYLYYLGEALLADSRIDSGRSLLRHIADSRGSEAWGRAAALALARPAGSKPAVLP